MMRAFLLFSALCLLVTGCPKDGDTTTSGGAGGTTGASWITFEVFEAGTGNGLSAMVWPDGSPADYETVVAGDAGADVRFEGIGRRDDGYALPLKPGMWVELALWSPGHEMQTVGFKVKRGANPVAVELVKAEVLDDRVPDVITTEVLDALPSAGPKSGS